LADQIEHALDDTRAITTPLDRPELGGTNGENAAHASTSNEHVDVSLGRIAVRKPGAREPKMPNVSKFRATKPRIEDADVHVRFAPNTGHALKVAFDPVATSTSISCCSSEAGFSCIKMPF
jgi:hypothetical protein